MKNILQAWNLKIIQEYLNIHYHLSNIDKTFNDKDVIEYIKSLNTTQLPNYQQQPPPPLSTPTEKGGGFVRKPIRKCPKCNGVLKLFSTQDGCKWECCKTCTTNPCGYIEYIDKDIEDVIKEYNG